MRRKYLMWNGKAIQCSAKSETRARTPNAGYTLTLLGGAFAMIGALGRRFRK
jgi:hypothetical protein